MILHILVVEDDLRLRPAVQDALVRELGMGDVEIRITWVSSIDEARRAMKAGEFDLVVGKFLHEAARGRRAPPPRPACLPKSALTEERVAALLGSLEGRVES